MQLLLRSPALLLGLFASTWGVPILSLDPLQGAITEVGQGLYGSRRIENWKRIGLRDLSGEPRANNGKF